MRRPTIVGTITIAMTIHTELRNDVQKASSPTSLIQLAAPMNVGARTPFQLVKVR